MVGKVAGMVAKAVWKERVAMAMEEPERAVKMGTAAVVVEDAEEWVGVVEVLGMGTVASAPEAVEEVV